MKILDKDNAIEVIDLKETKKIYSRDQMCCFKCVQCGKKFTRRLRAVNSLNQKCTSCQKSESLKNFYNSVDKKDFYEQKLKTGISNYGSITALRRAQVEARQQTCLKKYGVDSFSKTKMFKDQMKKTCIEKYGVDNISKVEQVKNKRKRTIQSRYGVNNAFEANFVKEKIKNTLHEKYGIENSFRISPHFKYKEEVFDSKWELAFWVYCKDKDIPIEREAATYSYVYDNKEHIYIADFLVNNKPVEIKGDHFFENDKMICPYDRTQDGLMNAKYECMKANKVKILRQNDCEKYLNYVVKTYGADFFEKNKLRHKIVKKTDAIIDENILRNIEIFRKNTLFEHDKKVDFIKSLPARFKTTIMFDVQIDAFYEKEKVAIQYLTSFENSDAFYINEYKKHTPVEYDSRMYKLHQEFNNNDIRLIQIWATDDPKISLSIIKSALNIYDKKYYARKLEFKEVSILEANKFFNENHIHKGTRANVAYALLDKDEIIQCVSFRKKFSARNKEGKHLELARMATKLNTQVVGGFSKLIKHGLKNIGATEVYSFVDLRIFNMSSYKKSGWQIINKFTGANYKVINGETLKLDKRQVYMKKNILKKHPEFNGDEETEYSMELKLGCWRIFDAGNAELKFSIDT